MSRPDADVIVIGSGFGGSITANRLALAGHKVLVLERGPWRDSLPVRSMGIARRAPFPYGWRALTHLLRTLQMGRFRLTLNKSGMFEFISFPGLRVLATSAVGGGSTAWGGLLERPRNPGYWSGRHPDLDPAQIERHYDKILADMGAVPLTPERWLPNSVWKHLPFSAEGRCRPAPAQPHVAVKLPQSASEAGQVSDGEFGVKRRTCAFDGDSFLGSRGGAKASVDFIYLAPVLGKGATVRDLCEVTKIAPDPAAAGGGYTVHFADLRTNEKQVVRARRIVLAAGPMNTLRLLFASLGGPQGLAPMPSLGRTFGANGDLLGVWIKDSGEISSFNSPPALGAFTVAGYDAPSFGMGGLPGVDTLPLPRAVKRKLARTVLIFGMGVDSGRASVGFEKGRLHVDYDSTQEPIFEEIRAAFRLLEAESGCRTWAVGTPIVPHQWGGACVGASDRHGVVDHNGEVYGNPGLFVADSSALPAAVGAPPSLAVAAWAHHVADRMAHTAGGAAGASCKTAKLPGHDEAAESAGETAASAVPVAARHQKRRLTRNNVAARLADFFGAAPVLARAFAKPRTSRALREKVVLAVTAINDCRYCAWGHTHWAMANGVSLDEVNRILGQQTTKLAVSDPAEAAAILFAQHYAEHHDRIDPDALENLRRHFGEAQVREIIAYIHAITLGNLLGNTVDAFLGRFRRRPT